jgi:hypothetical protein
VTSQTSGAWLSRRRRLDLGGGRLAGPGWDQPPGHGAQPQIVGGPRSRAGSCCSGRPPGARPGLRRLPLTNGTAWTFEATLAARGPGRRPRGRRSFRCRGHRAGGPDPDRLRLRERRFLAADPGLRRGRRRIGVGRGHGGRHRGHRDDHRPRRAASRPSPWWPRARPRPPGRCREDPRRLRPPARRQRVAAGAGTQVAVGSANGYPAAWMSADGGSSWTPPPVSHPGGLRPARRAAADRRDVRRRRLARGRRRHRGRRAASGRPFLG